uniref:Uncharacterized protein n=1 Tax=Pseudodiaptomus poplesia TaxID=213370 RepID=A0A0U2TLA8_9MAXI|nr:hypothetical protein [Pseudodiaptomus poplesia]
MAVRETHLFGGSRPMFSRQFCGQFKMASMRHETQHRA